MVHAGVIPRELQCLVGVPRKERRPDLRPDPCAVAVLPRLVVECSGKRRKKSVGNVALCHAVFVPRSGDVAHPVFRQEPLVQMEDPLLLHRKKVDQLKIQIIVRRWFPRKILRVKMDIEKITFPLHRCSECPADVLPAPAAGKPIQVFRPVQNVGTRHLSLFFLILLKLFLI